MNVSPMEDATAMEIISKRKNLVKNSANQLDHRRISLENIGWLELLSSILESFQIVISILILLFSIQVVGAEDVENTQISF